MTAESQLIHDLASKINASQLSLELVIQKLELSLEVTNEDLESLQWAFLSLREATELIDKHRTDRLNQESPLPKLATETKPSLLVVDDDEKLRQSMAKVFSNAGYITYECENGEQAIEILQNAEVDIVLTDIRMPGMSGDELSKRIRTMKKQPVLCIMSADQAELRNLQKRVSPDGVLRKPFSQRVALEEIYKAQIYNNEFKF